MKPTQLHIDLEAISRNVARLREIGGDRSAIVAVKGDAYGHGLVPVARRLEEQAAFLAVATVGEGEALRAAGIEKPILKMSASLADEMPDAVQARLTLAISSMADARAAEEAARSAGATMPLHIKIDTGMHRTGVAPRDVVELARFVADSDALELDGLFTHFASADDEAEQDFTKGQMATFRAAVAAVQDAVGEVRWLHAANSAGILNCDLEGTNAIRPGIAMYGSAPAWNAPGIEFEQPAQWTSRVTLVKTVAAGESVSYGRTWVAEEETQIATVAVGYGDGFSRLNSSRGRVLIDGKSYPIVGRVCMDQILIDVGDAAIAPGTEVVLMGASGNERITPQELADLMGTIPYEVTCLITSRVPRVY